MALTIVEIGGALTGGVDTHLDVHVAAVVDGEAAEAGGTAPAVLNAANEVAVAAFLDGRLTFPGIPRLIEVVLGRHRNGPAQALADVLEADRWARGEMEALLADAAVAGA